MSQINNKNASLFEKISEAGILPVICPANQFELDTLLDSLSGTTIQVLEITLRNDFSTSAIKNIKEKCPQLTVGAGTVNTPFKLEQALGCGAEFLVAPGIADFAHNIIQKHGIPFIHGVSNPSEILKLINLGYNNMKFFPSEISGGTRALKLYSSAFEGVKFIPTGGITADNLFEYLTCPNVIGCGGSFMAPKDLLAKGDSEGINKLIKSFCRQRKTL